MTIPYRMRRFLKTAAAVLLILLIIALFVWLVWLLWLDRFVVYTREEGAVLDFHLSAQAPSGEVAAPPENGETVPIYYNEGENQISTSTDLTQMIGYYVDLNALQEDIGAVRNQILTLPAGTPVLLDVKNITGGFYYSSTVSNQRGDGVDVEAVDALIHLLDSTGMYAIARIPALRDYNYGLNHVPDGLPTAGGYLWLDTERCYWLNPASEGTLTYLAQIITELRGLGFDEVVLTDFYFPETDAIVFNGDKDQAIASAAQTLVTSCATDSFAVSFTAHGATFPLPEGRCRLYLEGVAAADAANAAAQTGIANTAVNLVFLTEVNDTRFDVYGVLRPLDSAH